MLNKKTKEIHIRVTKEILEMVKINASPLTISEYMIELIERDDRRIHGRRAQLGDEPHAHADALRVNEQSPRDAIQNRIVPAVVVTTSPVEPPKEIVDLSPVNPQPNPQPKPQRSATRIIKLPPTEPPEKKRFRFW